MKNIERKFSELIAINEFNFDRELYKFFQILPPLSCRSISEIERQISFSLPNSFVYFVTKCSSGIISLSNNENIVDKILLKVNYKNNKSFKSLDLKNISSSFMDVRCYMDITDKNGNIWYNITQNEEIKRTTILDLDSISSTPNLNFEEWILNRLDYALLEVKRKKEIFNNFTKTIKLSFFLEKELSDLVDTFSKVFNIDLKRDYENQWEWIEGENEIYSINISRKHLNMKKGDYNEKISLSILFKKEIDDSMVESIKKNVTNKLRVKLEYVDNYKLTKNWLQQFV